MYSVYHYIKNPRIFCDSLLKKSYLAALLPDKCYVSLMYYFCMGKFLNLRNPKTFNEKLQWLKLYNRNPKYTRMVDKFEVKKLVANIIGNEYVVPTYGVWNSPEEIDFDSLPQQFVLKTTHGGGSCGVIICRNKSELNRDEVLDKLREAFKQNIYLRYREWPYKNVKPRIIAEQFLLDERCQNSTKALKDYKVYCFDGNVGFFLISNDREKGHPTFDYFDADFNHLPFKQGGENYSGMLERPECLDDMLCLASKLSQGIPHVRVDFYNLSGKIYFGEFTFFDASGFARFDPEEWDLHWGKLIQLPDEKR